MSAGVVAGCQDGAGPDVITGRPDVAPGPWAAVAGGGAFTCALDQAGRAYCWGENTGGQLAVGDAAYRHPVPLPVVGGLTFRSIAAGGAHVCALTAEGEAYCWGNDGAGQLGLGAVLRDYGAPITRPTPVATTVRFVQLSAAGHTCGVALDGAAYCWGPGGEGQLGVGPVGPCGPGDRVSYDDDFRLACAAAVPTPVAGGLRFASVSAGSQHTCGVTTDGVAYCWGFNYDAVLGAVGVPYDCPVGYADPDPNAAAAPCRQFTPVPVTTPLRFRQVAAGGLHTCGLSTDGRAYCWGLATGLERLVPRLQKSAAPLGAGSIAPGGSVTPVPVVGGLTFRELSARGGVSCGITADDRAVCWGGDGAATLGLGRFDGGPVARPQAVRMPLAAGAPVLAGDHACAITTTGRLFCWGGQNWYGELGNGEATDVGDEFRIYATPAPVIAPAP